MVKMECLRFLFFSFLREESVCYSDSILFRTLLVELIPKLSHFLLISLQFKMPQRISPFKDACNHVALRTDKTSKLEVKYINREVKGKMVLDVVLFIWLSV